MSTCIHFVMRRTCKDVAFQRVMEQLLLLFARKPDPGSYFEEEIRDMASLSDDAFLAQLVARNYECIVAQVNGEFAGYVAYQRHDAGFRGNSKPTWHSFSYRTLPDFKKRGIGTILARTFIQEAHNSGIRHMRFFGGDERGALDKDDHDAMFHIFEEIILKNRLGVPFNIVRGSGDGYGYMDLSERVMTNA